MAFTNISQLYSAKMPALVTTKNMVGAEAAPVFNSTWGAAGMPGPVTHLPGINGAALSYTGAQGELPITNSGTGKDLKLVEVHGLNRSSGMYMLCDRLWHNSGINVTTTTEQVITPPAIPARDINGAALGGGVWAALEMDTAASNAATIANCTIRFTNENGTANQVASPIAVLPTTINVASFIVFSTNTGVRSIEGITLGTSLLTGACRLVLFRPILLFATLPSNAHEANCGQDALAMCAPTIPPGAVLFMVYNNALVTATVHSFNMSFAEA